MKRLTYYVYLVLSVTFLAHSKVMYIVKPEKIIGRQPNTNQGKHQIHKTILALSSRAQTYLKKYIACLQDKKSCSKQEIQKARLYTSIIVAIAAGVGLKMIPERPVPVKPGKEELKPEEEEVLEYKIEGKEPKSSGKPLYQPKYLGQPVKGHMVEEENGPEQPEAPREEPLTLEI